LNQGLPANVDTDTLQHKAHAGCCNIVRLIRAALLLLLFSPRLCLAESLGVADVLTDAKLYFTAPLYWDTRDWLYFGGVLAAIGTAHQFDGDVRRHFAIGSRAQLNGQDSNSLRDAAPTAAILVGTWAFAQLSDSSNGHTEAYTMLESAGFSSVTTIALRYAAARARPNQTTQVDDWRSGGNSFPSLHTTAAFAVGTVLAESGSDDFRWTRRLLGYGIACATAYVRIRDNDHWLSDTVAGAAIGIATAQFTMNRREHRARPWEFSVAPAEGGGVALHVSLNML
jgi:membrane-associated phospholipid phosphatase